MLGSREANTVDAIKAAFVERLDGNGGALPVSSGTDSLAATAEERACFRGE